MNVTENRSNKGVSLENVNLISDKLPKLRVLEGMKKMNENYINIRKEKG